MKCLFADIPSVGTYINNFAQAAKHQLTVHLQKGHRVLKRQVANLQLDVCDLRLHLHNQHTMLGKAVLACRKLVRALPTDLEAVLDERRALKLPFRGQLVGTSCVSKCV